MSEEEWNDIISGGPDDSALKQLKDYEEELLAEYRQHVPQDTSTPTSLWKGVIVLDSDQSPMEVYPAFQYLLEDLMTGFIHQFVKHDTTTAVTPEPLSSGDATPKVALFIAPSNGPESLLAEMIPPDNLPFEDSFRDREPDDRILTLYVSIPDFIRSDSSTPLSKLAFASSHQGM